MAIVMLQQQAIIPFIMQQHEQSPPAIMVHKFCSMPADTLSSHTHMIFMPPSHFSNIMVHRGTIIMFIPVGAAACVPIIPGVPVIIPGMPIPARSIIIGEVISASP
jgi:hypothetical protein